MPCREVWLTVQKLCTVLNSKTAFYENACTCVTVFFSALLVRIDIATFSGSCLSGCICLLFDRFSDVSAGRLPEAGPNALDPILQDSRNGSSHTNFRCLKWSSQRRNTHFGCKDPSLWEALLTSRI